MTTIQSASKTLPHHGQGLERTHQPKKNEVTKEQVLYGDLLRTVLNDPARCGDIIPMFLKSIQEITSSYSTSPERRNLKTALRCLNSINDIFFNGDEKQQAMIAPHQEAIEAASTKALECLTQPVPSANAQTATTAIASPSQKEKSPLEKLVATALEKKDDDTLLTCLEKGAPTNALSTQDMCRLVEKAMTNFNDTALASLIRGGCPLFDSEGQSPLLLNAVSNNLIDSVRALIEKHANLHTRDAQKNTALHRAFFVGNPEMVTLLMQHSDPQSENAFSQTPLMALLSPHENNLDYLQLPEQKIPLFLEVLFKRSPEKVPGGTFKTTPALDMLVKISGGKLPLFPLDIVEMAYLAKNKDLDEVLFRTTSLETFLKALSSLEKRYPKESVSQFLATAYAINTDHFQMGNVSAPILPLGAKNPPLDRLLTLFDALNLRDPAAPHYFNPSVWWKGVDATHETLPPNEAIAKIRDCLKTGIERLVHRTPYGGVPPVEPLKTQWFERMELLLKHIIITLEEKNDPSKTLKAMKDLRNAFQYCATALNTTVVDLYESLRFNIDTTDPQLFFLRCVAKFRRQCFDDATNCVNNAEVHHGQAALVTLGPKLGLSGHETAALYKDPGFNGDGNAEAVRVEFFKRYTPAAILNDWLLPALQFDTDNIRSVYLDLHKRCMIPTWRQERYAPILKHLTSLEKERDTEKRTAAIAEFLRTSDIIKAENQPPREAVEQDQRGEYYATFVHDENFQFRPQAATYLLNCLGIFQSCLR